MPITQSAKKALRGSKRKRGFNLKKKELVSKDLKQVKKLIGEKKVKEAQALLPRVQKILDKASKTGLIKKNTASRRKSRIAKMLHKVK